MTIGSTVHTVRLMVAITYWSFVRPDALKSPHVSLRRQSLDAERRGGVGCEPTNGVGASLTLLTTAEVSTMRSAALVVCAAVLAFPSTVLGQADPDAQVGVKEGGLERRQRGGYRRSVLG